MIKDLLVAESERQNNTYNFIASENYVSDAVKEALASDLTNKYAEGQPGWRYYSGTDVVDDLENEVKSLAQKVFNTDYSVNVQAYSGSIANLAVYFALLEPGDPIMGLELSHGGHLTHGHSATISGKLYSSHSYKVDKETGRIDYDALEKQAQGVKPKLIISGASAYPREIDFKRINKVAQSVGALHLADISHISGLIATGLHQSPFGLADIVMTTTHKLLRGPRGALLFSKPEIAAKIDKAIFPGIQGGPHMNTIAAVGVCLEEALEPSYKEYCENVISNAKVLADELSKAGLEVLTNGTENHLILIDLRPLSVTGQDAQNRLEGAGITVNMNSIPYDEASPRNPSGLRLGTPAVTTRGIGTEELKSLAQKIADILKG